MANKYPYVASAGPLVKTIVHLRRSFPKEVTADTLKKLGVAPKNESYVINVLRFLTVIDEDGNKVNANNKAFVQHQEEAFAAEFQKLVMTAYKDLFDHYGEAAWDLDKAALTQFFRTSDRSTQVVGERQAGTFTYLAGLSGHSELPAVRTGATSQKTPSRKAGKGDKGAGRKAVTPMVPPANSDNGGHTRLGLTVRIEVNLPAEGDQGTYDRIFQSIRKNLIDVE